MSKGRRAFSEAKSRKARHVRDTYTVSASVMNGFVPRNNHVRSTFTAQYPGTCPECREAIVPGDLLTKDSEGWSIHQRCKAQPGHIVGKAETICPECFLTACDCDS